jgi:HAD superfamily hydrolase (TIGR01509 family)
MFDGVIFDLDGTLIDSESVTMAAGTLAFAAHGYQVTPDLLHSLIGVDEPTGARMLYAALGPDLPLPAIEADWRRATRARYEETGVPLRPKVLDLLAALASLGLPLAVATSSSRDGADWKLQRAGLRAHFATVVTLDCVPRPKPAPDPFLIAARRLGLNPSRCIAFEDSETGAASAMAAGMTVVQVPDVVPTQGRHATFVAPDLLSGARAAGLLA